MYFSATLIYFKFTNNSSKKSYSDMIYHLLHTLTSFFDVTPSGRIINRAVKDSDSYDLLFPRFIRITLMHLISVTALIIFSIISTWPSIFIYIIYIGLFIYFYGIFRSVTP